MNINNKDPYDVINNGDIDEIFDDPKSFIKKIPSNGEPTGRYKYLDDWDIEVIDSNVEIKISEKSKDNKKEEANELKTLSKWVALTGRYKNGYIRTSVILGKRYENIIKTVHGLYKLGNRNNSNENILPNGFVGEWEREIYNLIIGMQKEEEEGRFLIKVKDDHSSLLLDSMIEELDKENSKITITKNSIFDNDVILGKKPNEVLFLNSVLEDKVGSNNNLNVTENLSVNFIKGNLKEKIDNEKNEKNENVILKESVGKIKINEENTILKGSDEISFSKLNRKSLNLLDKKKIVNIFEIFNSKNEKSLQNDKLNIGMANKINPSNNLNNNNITGLKNNFTKRLKVTNKVKLKKLDRSKIKNCDFNEENKKLNTFKQKENHIGVKEEMKKGVKDGIDEKLKDGTIEKMKVEIGEKMKDGIIEKVEDGSDEKVEVEIDEKMKDGIDMEVEDGTDEKVKDGIIEKVKDGIEVKDEIVENVEDVEDGTDEKTKDEIDKKVKDGIDEKVKDGIEKNDDKNINNDKKAELSVQEDSLLEFTKGVCGIINKKDSFIKKKKNSIDKKVFIDEIYDENQKEDAAVIKNISFLKDKRIFAKTNSTILRPDISIIPTEENILSKANVNEECNEIKNISDEDALFIESDDSASINSENMSDIVACPKRRSIRSESLKIDKVMESLVEKELTDEEKNKVDINQERKEELTDEKYSKVGFRRRTRSIKTKRSSLKSQESEIEENKKTNISNVFNPPTMKNGDISFINKSGSLALVDLSILRDDSLIESEESKDNLLKETKKSEKAKKSEENSLVKSEELKDVVKSASGKKRGSPKKSAIDDNIKPDNKEVIKKSTKKYKKKSKKAMVIYRPRKT